MSRIALERYKTPTWAVTSLFKVWNPIRKERFDLDPIQGTFCEPCYGSGSIVKTIQRNNLPLVYSWGNDIDRSSKCSMHLDASTKSFETFFDPVDLIITNPPYDSSIMLPMVSNFIKLFTKLNLVKYIALLMPITYLEPCNNREFLHINHPSNGTIILPRFKFNNIGSDRVTTAWHIWDMELENYQFFSSVHKSQIPDYYPSYEKHPIWL